MFGYIVANFKALEEKDKKRYRRAYCGLCHSMGKRYGNSSRLTLNYDMTFLLLFLSAVYADQPEIKEGKCLPHMIKKQSYIIGRFADYAADMSIILSYYNSLDDWNDDKNILSFGKAALVKSGCGRAENIYPRQTTVIKESLNELERIQREGVINPDIAASCFGNLLGEVFAMGDDCYTNDLREFGAALGRFVYLLDACIDLKKDIKKCSYNPLLTTPSEYFKEILNMLMADCVEKYEKFPAARDDQLIKNILFSGIWTKYEMAAAKERKNK